VHPVSPSALYWTAYPTGSPSASAPDHVTVRGPADGKTPVDGDIRNRTVGAFAERSSRISSASPCTTRTECTPAEYGAATQNQPPDERAAASPPSSSSTL